MLPCGSGETCSYNFPINQMFSLTLTSLKYFLLRKERGKKGLEQVWDANSYFLSIPQAHARKSGQRIQAAGAPVCAMPLIKDRIQGKHVTLVGFPVMLMVKNLPANAGDIKKCGSIPGSGRSPGGGQGNPLQYSCLEIPHGQRILAGYSP